MQLQYFHTVFEMRTRDCPGEYWETIIHFLPIKLAIYGHSRMDEDPHQLHIIFEDDPAHKTYNMLPIKYRARSKFVKKIKEDLITFSNEMKMSLVDEPDLCVTDNI